MTKVAFAIEELHRAETKLAGKLLRASDRHKAEHEIHHLGRDLARWSQHHARELARVGATHGLELDADTEDDATILDSLRQKGSELLGRNHDPGLLLLADLRELHRMASGVSLDWEVLAQSAQGIQDLELLEVAKKCHPDTLRQMRWTNGMVKELSAQILLTP